MRLSPWILTSLLVASVCLPTRAQNAADAKIDLSGKAAKKKDQKPALQESEVEVPHGRPDELLDLIENARPRPEFASDSKEDRQRRQIFFALKAADKVLAHEGATDDEKTLARQYKLRALYSISELDASYSGRFYSFVQEVVRDFPGSNVAALGTAMMFLRDYFNRPGGFNEVMNRLNNFAKTYPKSPVGGELFSIYGRRMEQEERSKDAIAVYKAALAAYPDLARSRQDWRGSLTRLELIGQKLDLGGPTLDGSEISVDKLKGKVVLIDFWATWCGVCVAEMPALLNVYEEYKAKGFEIVGVNLDENKAEVEKFVKERKLPWPQIFFPTAEKQGQNNPIATKLAISAIPVMILVDKDGRVVSTTIRGERSISKAVRALLDKPSPQLAN